MILNHLNQVIGSERDVAWGNGQSRRLLLKRDGMGFALVDSTVNAGTSTPMQYRNHLMAAYVIEGEGILELEDGTRHVLGPGFLYALDKHDRYTLHAVSELRVLCVFNPPIEGNETHDTNGAASSSY